MFSYRCLALPARGTPRATIRKGQEPGPKSGGLGHLTHLLIVPTPFEFTPAPPPAPPAGHLARWWAGGVSGILDSLM